MTLNNRTFTLLKIVLLIIISIFIAEIIVLPKIEHDMLQEAGRQELVTVQQICGAVLEVLDNAVKYSPRNSHITISIEKQHFYTLVKIKDEGIGIPQNEYNKIFQRFYRSNHSYVKQTEGSGVGLYLTRMILERQGGLIRVESVPEKGSTFILQFRN